MRRSNGILLVPAVICLLLLVSTSLLAQEWSPAQKEVWKNVEAYWALNARNDLEGTMTYYHQDYRGWHRLNGLPSDKSAVRKFDEYYFKTSTVLVYDLRPAAIVLFGDNKTCAYIHYYYHIIYKDAENKEINERGRWTDILVKQGDKWILIGDHGGPTKNN